MKDSKAIRSLEQIGLTNNQALVYYALLKSGSKGNIVKMLDNDLDIARPNIYPVLKELIQLGCVKEGGKAEKSKNATIYIAEEPIKFTDHLISKKHKEIEELLEFKNKESKKLQEVFIDGIKIHKDDLNEKILPYLEPLIDAGWNIQSYTEREELAILNYKVYDCIMRSPSARFLKDCSFHVFEFDYNIETDQNALEFFSKGLKRKTKEMRSYFFDITKFKLQDGTINLFNNEYQCFSMLINVKDINDSEYFTDSVSNVSKKGAYYEVGKAVIVPVNEKIFYLWGESDKILEELVKPIRGIKIKTIV